MLNINAPNYSFAYKVAIENKQLGWFFNKDKSVNLFDLIFKTKKELKKYPDYYFDWNLDLFFFKSCFPISLFNESYLIKNIPFILDNSSLVKETLYSLNISFLEFNHTYYLDLSKLNFKFDLPKVEYEETFYTDFDFWRYFYFYTSKQIRQNLTSIIVGDDEVKLIDKICKIKPNFFSNISKRDLKNIELFIPRYYEHNLDFLDCTDLSVISKVLKLEKKYGIKIFGLLSLLQRLPTDKEIKEWEINLKLDLQKDLRLPVLENKLLKLEYGWQVHELTTKLDLMEEATYQHNCLQGFINTLSNPDYNFFSCRKNKERFTVLFINGKLHEYKGRFNKDVSKFSQEIREELEYILLNLEVKINGRK